MINISDTQQLKTSVTYYGTGSQTNFDFPFDYLRKAFIHVTINDVEVSDYSIDSRTIIFETAPSEGAIINIYRSTDTTRLVAWADASVLKASDMTISQVQQLHILEEGQDWSKINSIYLDENDSKWQGNNHPMKNISDPVDAKDVVTKGYMETVQSGFVTENTKIKDEATRQAGLAKDEKLKAQQYAEAASDSKDLAKRWAEATDSPDYTTSKSAKTWAEEAKDARDEAKDIVVNLGNPVSDVTENNGTVTVTKSNGTQSTFMAFPQDANGTLPIAKGGTGATSAISALSNLGILDAIVNASVSGKTITFTKKDNTKFSIDTQDTNNGIVAALLEQNGYIKFANGLILQWGVSITSKKGPITITYPIAHTIFACPYTTSTMNSNSISAINTSNNTVQSFDVHALWSNTNVADTFNWFSVGI